MADAMLMLLRSSIEFARRAHRMSSYLDDKAKFEIQFTVRVHRVRKECELILRELLSDSGWPREKYAEMCENLQQMCENLQHPRWDTLREGTQHLRADRRDAWAVVGSLVRLLAVEINAVEEKLRQIEAVANGTGFLLRVRDRLEVAFFPERFEAHLDEVNRLLSELTSFRETLESQSMESDTSTYHAPLSTNYQRKRKSATGLAQAFTAKWACSNRGHRHHTLRLLLSPRNQNPLTSPEEAHVVMQHYQVAAVRPEIYIMQIMALQPGRPSPSRDQQVFLTSANPMSSRVGDRRSQLTQRHAESQSSSGEACMCSQLLYAAAPFASQYKPFATLGHNHEAYNVFQGSKNMKKLLLEGNSATKLDEIFNLSNNKLDYNNILLVPTNVIRSALALYGTPWWPANWTSDSLSYYKHSDPAIPLGHRLETMHLSIPLPDHETSGPDTSANTTGEIPTDIAEAMREHNIHNLSLLCLGVLFLQFWFWETIDWGDMQLVSRKLDSLRGISPKRWKIANRLIHCRFGSGKDLESEDLQSEIHSMVVCELEQMLKRAKEATSRDWLADSV